MLEISFNTIAFINLVFLRIDLLLDVITLSFGGEGLKIIIIFEQLPTFIDCRLQLIFGLGKFPFPLLFFVEPNQKFLGEGDLVSR